jgi:hypothetical protein
MAATTSTNQNSLSALRASALERSVLTPLFPFSVYLTNKVINRNGTTSELTSLGIFDDTSDASLTLYSSLCDSASSFTPSHTILLISCPGWRIEKTAKLSVNANSRIDIDPDLSDARRLRALAQRVTKKVHVNPPFPVSLRDVEDYENARVKALYTLADIDDFARANPKEVVVGYMSVVLTQLNIVTPYKRNMLMCNECCGIAVFANALEGKCRGCEKVIALRINPRIVRPPHFPPHFPNISRSGVDANLVI